MHEQSVKLTPVVVDERWPAWAISLRRSDGTVDFDAAFRQFIDERVHGNASLGWDPIRGSCVYRFIRNPSAVPCEVGRHISAEQYSDTIEGHSIPNLKLTVYQAHLPKFDPTEVDKWVMLQMAHDRLAGHLESRREENSYFWDPVVVAYLHRLTELEQDEERAA